MLRIVVVGYYKKRHWNFKSFAIFSLSLFSAFHQKRNESKLFKLKPLSVFAKTDCKKSQEKI